MELDIGEIILEEEVSIGEIELDVIKEYPELEDLVITPKAEQQTFKSDKYGYNKVTVNAIESEEISIIPSTEKQELNGLFGKITVDAIDGETLNINPSEELQTKDGVFLQVNVNPIQTEEVIADLDFSSEDTVEIIAQDNKYIKKAIINKDSNLLPENIKKGTEIFGVQGTANISNIKITNANYLFYNNARLDIINELLGLCENATTTVQMFGNCSNLTTLDLSNFNTSRVTNMGYMFNFCNKLIDLDISNFDMSEVIIISNMLGCTNLTNLKFGINLGKGFTSRSNNNSNYKLTLSNSTSLTHESLMSIINNLYDLNLTYNVANGGILYTQSLNLGRTNKAKLTDEEIAIATSKGWNVT